MDEIVKNAIKWLALTFGVKHPVISTVCAMAAAGILWVIFFKSVAANVSEPSSAGATINLKAVDPNCGNIVVVGGTQTCEVDKEEKSESDKEPKTVPRDSH
jgi:hypothetical protein